MDRPVPAAQPCVACCAPLPPGVCAESPEAVAARAALQSGSFWLDSADAEHGSEAWSFVGWNAERVVTCGAPGAGERGGTSFLDVVRREASSVRLTGAGERRPDEPPWRGGWFTFLSYDLGRAIERLPERAVSDLFFPGLFMAWHPVLLAFSHRENRWWAAGVVLPPHGTGIFRGTNNAARFAPPPGAINDLVMLRRATAAEIIEVRKRLPCAR